MAEVQVEEIVQFTKRIKKDFSRREILEKFGYSVIEARGDRLSISATVSCSRDEALATLAPQMQVQLDAQQAKLEELQAELAKFQQHGRPAAEDPAEWMKITDLMKLTPLSESEIRRTFVTRKVTPEEIAARTFGPHARVLFKNERKFPIARTATEKTIPLSGVKQRRNGIVVDAEVDYGKEWVERLGCTPWEFQKKILTGEFVKCTTVVNSQQKAARGLSGNQVMYRRVRRNGLDASKQQQTL